MMLSLVNQVLLQINWSLWFCTVRVVHSVFTTFNSKLSTIFLVYWSLFSVKVLIFGFDWQLCYDDSWLQNAIGLSNIVDNVLNSQEITAASVGITGSLRLTLESMWFEMPMLVTFVYGAKFKQWMLLANRLKVELFLYQNVNHSNLFGSILNSF